MFSWQNVSIGPSHVIGIDGLVTSGQVDRILDSSPLFLLKPEAPLWGGLFLQRGIYQQRALLQNAFTL